MKILFFIFLLVFSFNLFSKEPSKQEQKTQTTNYQIKKSTQTEILKTQETSNSKEKTKQTAQSDNYDYEGGVMVDSLSYENENVSYDSGGEFQETVIDNDALPYSYGILKGAISIEGKPMLILEGDDGSINIIYVYFDKTKLKWKLFGKIKRS
ncbi:MAG: hypothetical protein K6357_05375 [Elusimicrobiota bacterium]